MSFDVAFKVRAFAGNEQKIAVTHRAIEKWRLAGLGTLTVNFFLQRSNLGNCVRCSRQPSGYQRRGCLIKARSRHKEHYNPSAGPLWPCTFTIFRNSGTCGFATTRYAKSTDPHAMLERYRFVSADDDVEDLMEENIAFAHETAEYGYEDDDEDDLEAPVELKPALMAVPVLPPAPPPPEISQPIALEKSVDNEMTSIAEPKKRAARANATVAENAMVAKNAISKRVAPPAAKAVAKKAQVKTAAPVAQAPVAMAPVKKAVAKKAASKKAAVKKSVKTAAKKAVPPNAVAKKIVAKKAIKNVAAKKVAAKKAPAKNVAAKKAPAKKVAAKKAIANKKAAPPAKKSAKKAAKKSAKKR